MTLVEWQLARLATIHHDKVYYGSGRDDVTVIIYHFWGDDCYDAAFKRVECAIRETWLHCGMMRTVIVTNKSKPCVDEFIDKFPAVSMQVEPGLIPGKIYTMSTDMNGRLWDRFDTPYCLVVQNDGFPLRQGLDDFIGKYDFIGAPYIRNVWWKSLIARLLNYHVQNGGFSLRSKAICAATARYWNEKFAVRGEFPDASEDLFYTKFLPLREPSYRHRFRFGHFAESLSFSYDAIVPIARPESLPFGFHGEEAFNVLVSTKIQNAKQ